MDDLANWPFAYRIEDIPGLADKLLRLLNDEDSSVKPAALNMLGNLQYRMDSKRKKDFLSGITDRVAELSLQDKDVGVRSRALYLLAEIGSARVVDLIIQFLKSEPSENYSKLGVLNSFIRVAEAGLGYDLAKRLYGEASKSQSPEAQARFIEALSNLRNHNWAR